MKILFLSISMPDLRVSSNMYAALVKEFARRGHEVCVVAPVSDGTGTRLSAPAENIRLLQVKSLPLFGVNLVRKGIANVLLPFVYQRAIDAHLRGEKFDLIIAPTPPITLADVARGVRLANEEHNRAVLGTALAGLPKPAIEYLLAMCEEEKASSTGAIAQRLGKRTADANTYRRILIARQVIEATATGYVAFSMPRMRAYLMGHREEILARYGV